MSSITDDFLLGFRRDTERQWSHGRINKGIYGFQIQPGTRWLPGLSETMIDEYGQRLGLRFPNDVRKLLRHLNGTDQPTLNVYGNCGEPFRTGPGVYSYPRDIEHVLSRVQDVAEDRSEIAGVLTEQGFDLPQDAGLLPFFSHRYVVCGRDRESSAVLSIVGTDAILFADNLREYLLNEFLKDGQPGASPNGGPAERVGNPGVSGGPPSVS